MGSGAARPAACRCAAIDPTCMDKQPQRGARRTRVRDAGHEHSFVGRSAYGRGWWHPVTLACPAHLVKVSSVAPAQREKSRNNAVTSTFTP